MYPEYPNLSQPSDMQADPVYEQPKSSWRDRLVGSVLVTLTFFLCSLVPALVVLFVLVTHKSLQEGFGSLIVLMYVGIPVMIGSWVAGFMISRRILYKREWSSPGFKLVIAILAAIFSGVLAQLATSYLAYPAGLAAFFIMLCVLEPARLNSKFVVFGLLACAALVLGIAIPKVNSVMTKKTNSKLVTNASVPVWLPADPPVRFAPIKVEQYTKGVLRFGTPALTEIYESKAPSSGLTPHCGPLYYPDDGTGQESSDCKLQGVLPTGQQVYSEAGGNTFVVFGSTLVVVRPVMNFFLPGIQQDLFDYLKSFRQVDASQTNMLLADSNARLKTVLDHQTDYLKFSPLLPKSTPAGFKRETYYIQGLFDPENPSLELVYRGLVNGQPVGETVTVDISSPRPSFQPPKSCGGLMNSNQSDDPTCTQTDTFNGWPIYTSTVYPETGQYFAYYLTNKTFVVVEAQTPGLGTSIIKSLAPATKSEIDRAKRTTY